MALHRCLLATLAVMFASQSTQPTMPSRCMSGSVACRIVWPPRRVRRCTTAACAIRSWRRHMLSALSSCRAHRAQVLAACERELAHANATAGALGGDCNSLVLQALVWVAWCVKAAHLARNRRKRIFCSGPFLVQVPQAQRACHHHVGITSAHLLAAVLHSWPFLQPRCLHVRGVGWCGQGLLAPLVSY
jgi:hypothetical protein